MSRSSSVAIALLLLAFPAVWLAGCAGGATVDQAETPIPESREAPRVVDQHTREFKISVDGKERGLLTMLLTKHDDGTETMRGQTELSLNFIVYKYRYIASGTETWKSGRLIRLENEADYNGDKYVVQAAAQEQELAFEINGESQRASGDVWVTSYWREPEPHKIGQILSLFEANKGRKLSGTLQRIGKEQLTVDGKTVDATHYQIRGDVEVDLWYGDDQRLMRQDSVESGHRALIELTQITRE